MTRSIPRALAALLCLLLGTISIAHAGSWRAETTIGGKLQTHVYVPDGTSQHNDQRALMVSLHGCTQTNDEMKQGASWADEADEYGMVIALPQASNEGSYGGMGCWNFHVGMNMSRTSSDAKYLLDLVDALLDDSSLNIDPDQVYITGLSSGGGMASSIGCLAPDVFAGVGVNAGPGPGSDGNVLGLNSPDITVSQGKSNCETLSNKNGANAQAHLYTQVHNSVCGSNDSTVSPAWCDRNADIMVAVYGADTAINSCNGGDNPTSIDGSGTVSTWCDAEADRVSKIIIGGMGHAWPAGPDSSGGGNYIDHNYTDYPAYIAAFLTDNNRRVAGNGDDGGGDGDGRETGACEAFVDTNTGHESDGRAYSQTSGYWWNETTTWYAQGSDENLGTVGSNQTTLYQGNDGSYYLNDPADCPVDDGGDGEGDTTAPVISLNGDASMSLSVGDSFVDPGATATDNVDGDISSQIVVTGSVDTSTAGTYTLDYDVSDAAGNDAATVTRTVVVGNPYACQEYTSSNWAHYDAGRAVSCSWNVCAVGSGDNMGLNNTYTTTTLAETAAGYYELGNCP